MSTHGMSPAEQDARDLEKLSDRAFRALNEVRDALVEGRDRRRAKRRVLAAISEIGDGLDDLALRRARRYLRARGGEQ
jgi:hypothetical protein